MSNQQALSGLRILDLTDASGAYGVRLLSDLGADVIRVERPDDLQERRAWPIAGAPGETWSLTALYDNLGKRSITLNLFSESGQSLFRKLVATTDALIASGPLYSVNQHPQGWLGGIGLGYDALSAINPQLVYTYLSPFGTFGEDGPRAGDWQTPLTALAAGGLLSTMGYPEGPPLQPAVPLAYLLGGQHAAVFTQIALLGRRLIGRGQFVDVSMQACVAAAVEGPLQTYFVTGSNYPRIGPVRTLEPPNGTYACRDGHFCLFVLNWPGLAEWAGQVLGDDRLADPKYNLTNAQRAVYADEVVPAISEFCSRLTRAELLYGAHRTGQIGGAVMLPAEVLNDPHLKERDYFQTVEIPGLGDLLLPGAPYRLSETPWRCPDRAPAAGADNAAIFCDELGLDPKDLQRLQAAGIV